MTLALTPTESNDKRPSRDHRHRQTSPIRSGDHCASPPSPPARCSRSRCRRGGSTPTRRWSPSPSCCQMISIPCLPGSVPPAHGATDRKGSRGEFPQRSTRELETRPTADGAGARTSRRYFSRPPVAQTAAHVRRPGGDAGHNLAREVHMPPGSERASSHGVTGSGSGVRGQARTDPSPGSGSSLRQVSRYSESRGWVSSPRAFPWSHRRCTDAAPRCR
jgi:hypothetical protein